MMFSYLHLTGKFLPYGNLEQCVRSASWLYLRAMRLLLLLLMQDCSLKVFIILNNSVLISCLQAYCQLPVLPVITSKESMQSSFYRLDLPPLFLVKNNLYYAAKLIFEFLLAVSCILRVQNWSADRNCPFN